MSNENYGQIDNDHLETMFIAMDDTIGGVTGSEGFGLTQAQHYAYAVLGVSDSLTRQQKVDGNESFFGSIGDGLKAVWEYIKKMFKSISNFFFGSTHADVGTQVIADADKRIADAQKAIQGMKVTFNADLTQSIKKMAADPETSPSDKKEAETLVETLHTTPPPSPSQVKHVAERFAKINSKQQKKLQRGLVQVKEKADSLISYISKLHNETGTHAAGGESYTVYKAIIDELFSHHVGAVRSAVNHLDGAMIVSDMGQGARLLVVLKQQLKTVESLNSFIKANKHNLEHRVTQCEKVLGFKGDHVERKAEARAELGVAKDLMTAVNSTATYIHNTCRTMEGLCDTVCHIFGIKP